MGNCVSKTKSENTPNIEKSEKSEKEKKSFTKLDLNLHGYPPINFRKTWKSGFRIGVYIDIGVKDFEAGVTFGKYYIQEINFSENNNHLKLLKSLENEDRSSNTEKDKIIASLIDLNKKDQNAKQQKDRESV